MKGLGDQFLTGAALAGDENGALGIRHLFDQGEHLAECFALSDNPVEAVARLEFALEPAVLALELAVFDGLIDQAPNHVEALLLKRLFEIPECTGPQGLEGALRAAESRDYDAGQVRADLVNSLDDVQAVHAGHLDVT